MQESENRKPTENQPAADTAEAKQSEKTEKQLAAESWLAEFIRKTQMNIRK